jgi:hypothetical protein
MPNKWDQYASSPQQAPANNWDQYASSPATTPPAASPAPQKGFMDTLADAGVPGMDVAKGLVKGAAGTVANIDQAARKYLPAFMTNQNFGFGKPTDIEAEQKFAQPENTAQKIGKYAEQAGEYLLPGAGEEKAAAGLAKAFPAVGKAAAPMARIATKALGSGAVGAAQGNGFGTGAAIGAVGGALPEAISAIPTRAKAGQLFDSVMEDAKDQPVNLTNSMPFLERTQQLASSGAAPFRPADMLFSRSNQINPILYPEARDFASNISRMSAAEKMGINPQMQAEAGKLSRAFNKDIGTAAENVGRGEDYAKAMKDYARASALRENSIKAGKIAGKSALAAAGAGGLYGLARAFK